MILLSHAYLGEVVVEVYLAILTIRDHEVLPIDFSGHFLKSFILFLFEHVVLPIPFGFHESYLCFENCVLSFDILFYIY